MYPKVRRKTVWAVLLVLIFSLVAPGLTSAQVSDSSVSDLHKVRKIASNNSVRGKSRLTYRVTNRIVSSTGTNNGEIQPFTEFAYTGAVQTWTAPQTGTYKLETWGAQGGVIDGYDHAGGLGGYASGEIELNAGAQLYVYVGGKGVSTTADVDNCTCIHPGGWNGGGDGAGWAGPSGGGATDFRKGGTDASNRILVAGGGGGGLDPSESGYSGNNNGGNESNLFELFDGQDGPSGYIDGYPKDTAGGGGGYWGGQSIDGDDAMSAFGGSNFTGTLATPSSLAGIQADNGKAKITLLTAQPAPNVNEVDDNDKVITGSAKPGWKVTVTTANTILGSATAGVDGQFSITIPAQLAGTILMVSAADTAGNVSNIATVTVKDGTPPRAPTVNTVTEFDTAVTGSAESGSIVILKKGDVELGSATANVYGSFSIAISPQPSGTILTVTATDAAGNVSAITTITVKDATPPSPPIVNPVGDNDKVVTGTAEAGAKISIKVLKTEIGSAITDADGHFSVTIPAQSARTILTITATDAVGNVSESATVTVLDDIPTLNTNVTGWGDNYYGQITIPANLTHAIAVAAGHYHTLALKDDGTVVAWGWNFDGQTNVPAGLDHVISIAAGYEHSVALKDDGTVVAWGHNNYGQSTVPANLTGVKAIAAGDYFTIAVKDDGTVVAWGSNGFSQTNIPANLTGVKAIAAGADHAVALKNDGTVVAWGSNGYGQTNVPANLTNVKAIAAGGDTTVALKDDGTIVEWGLTGQYAVPAKLTGVKSIAAGSFNNVIAVKADGSVVEWGQGGELSVPSFLPPVEAAAVGRDFTIIVLATPIAAPVVNKVRENDNLVTGAAQPGSKITVRAGTVELGSGTTGENGEFSVSIPPQSLGKILIVSATDTAGNESLCTTITVIDGTPPSLPNVNEVIENDKTVTGTAEPDSIVSVKAGETVLGSATAGADGQFSVSIPAQSGGTVLTVTATDAAGNVSEGATLIVTDITPPSAPIVNGVKDSDNAVTGTAEPGSLITIFAGKTKVGTATAERNGQFSVTIPVQPGGTVLTVTATDSAGNVSEGTTLIVKDVTPPSAPVVNEISVKDKAITGTTEPGSIITVKAGNVVLGTATAEDNGLFAISVRPRPAGTVLTVTETDNAGNTSPITEVTVKDPMVLSMILVKQITLDLKVGTGTQLSVVACYSDGSTKDITKLAKYQSSNSHVLSVNATGYVTAMGKGTADLNISYKETSSAGKTSIVTTQLKGTVN